MVGGLLSTWNMASAIEEVRFSLYSVSVYLNSHLWLVTPSWDGWEVVLGWPSEPWFAAQLHHPPVV